jgi:hypothetical protein
VNILRAGSRSVVMEVAVEVEVEVQMSDRGSRWKGSGACGMAKLGAKSAGGGRSCIAGVQETWGEQVDDYERVLRG